MKDYSCCDVLELSDDLSDNNIGSEKYSFEYAKSIFEMPLMDLIFKAQSVHRENFKPNEVQVSQLLNIKTGSCPENCKYCSQSAFYNTGLKKEPLMDLEKVVEEAKRAKDSGATRFCMGAAWRGPREDDLNKVCEMVKAVKDLGLETCATLGLLKDGQAEKLRDSGLDFYNHNIDTSPDYYKNVISTRTFDDRVNTLNQVKDAGIKVCCGGSLGMGEKNDDRIKMLVFLANSEFQPESVPINKLIPVPGTPLQDAKQVDSFDFIRTIALARILMPRSYVRLSAGRENMSFETQAMCFLAGANSIFYGDTLLTANNSPMNRDKEMFEKLGLISEKL